MFLDQLRKGHPFNIDVETIDAKTVTFLEVRVTKHLHSYVCQPEAKPSSLNVPWLSRYSCHPPHVHNSWPLAGATTRMGLCSNLQIKCSDLSSFILRAKSQHLTHQSILALLSLQSLIKSQVCDHKRSGAGKKADTIWLVLPYLQSLHIAEISRDLHALLNTNCIRRELMYLVGTTNVKIGWKNAMPSIQYYLAKTRRTV